MMDRERRQQDYMRRASQHDNLEVSRSKHEEFRTSMFSTARRDSTPAGALTADYSLSRGSSEDKTSSARIDAAIKAAMAVDSTRGAATFNQINLTPQASVTSFSANPEAFAAPQGDWAGGALAIIPGMDMAQPMSVQPQVRKDSWSRDSGSGGVDGVGNSRGSGSGGGAYRTYQPPVAGGGIPGGIAGGGVGANGAGYRTGGPTTRALPPTDDSLGSASAGHRSGSVGDSDSSGRRFVPSTGGSGGNSSGNGDAYGGAAYGGVAKRIDANGHRRGGGNSSGGGGGGGGGSGGVQQPTRTMWERGGGVPTSKAVWQQEPPAMIVPVSGGSAEGFSSAGSSGEVGHGAGSRQQFQNDDGHNHLTEDSSGALAPPTWQSSPDMPPVDADGGGTGGAAVGDGMSGGGEGVTLTPTGYDEPLELPDGCHHISLTKFLEVMTGPGLRVRKHHRAGKGSSGLRVLRYSEDEDSLTWDSHKILGAAQHVLPMSDVENVSMQTGNRVVLLCVGGRDSYAVFEAANEDAAAVLYVGLERLRERTQSRNDSV